MCTVSEILTYFFSARHNHYAHYGTYYFKDMPRLQPEIDKKFLQGEHTTRHVGGIWDNIWSDMMIESSLMKYVRALGLKRYKHAHSKSGIIVCMFAPKFFMNLVKCVAENREKWLFTKKRDQTYKVDGIICK